MKTQITEEQKARTLRIIDQAYKYQNLRNAETFVYETATARMMLVLGDDNRYWAVTPADAQRLERGGYTIIA